VNRLPAIKRGEDKPATPAEATELALVCSTSRQKEYALALRLYTEAFAAVPGLANPTSIHRYNAACAAVRLAAGDDPSTPVEVEQAAALRNQAREWLAAGLVALRTYAKSDRRPVVDWFAQWVTGPDLVSVRDPQRLAGLPEDERKAWEELWGEVEALRKVVGPLPAPPAGQ
jgi:hypothetical protein